MSNQTIEPILAACLGVVIGIGIAILAANFSDILNWIAAPCSYGCGLIQ